MKRVVPDLAQQKVKQKSILINKKKHERILDNEQVWAEEPENKWRCEQTLEFFKSLVSLIIPQTFNFGQGERME